MHAIHTLRELGQSVWLDFIDRSHLASGEVDRMIADDGLAGMTSNPTIFQKSLAHTADYDPLIRRSPESDSDATTFERIQVEDITLACDRFRGVYERTRGGDGFVSIEVAPSLARDTAGSIEAARRLWTTVSRPNLMVKIPGTREGLPAIEQCLYEGININITLLFSVDRYLEVAKRYLSALERRLAEGRKVEGVASVASFFVSRVDTKVDKALDALSGSARESGRAERGKIAIANAKLAYEEYEHLVWSDRWQALATQGARPQRLLWGSTSSKDPAYPDLYYVEALVGPDTIDTMPLETFKACIDHGRPTVTLPRGRDEANTHLTNLAALGIDLRRITDELEDEGIAAFAKSFDTAVRAIGEKRRALKRTA